MSLSLEWQSLRHEATAASLGSCVLNLANTILGAGLLGLPHAFAQCGVVIGLGLLVGFAFFSALGLYLLSAAADQVGRPASFRQVAHKAIPGSGLLIDLAIAIKCFGVATSYLIVVGDSIPMVLPASAPAVLLERRVWSVAAAVVVSPLCFLRKIDALRFTSMIALVCIVLITLMVAGFSLTSETPSIECTHIQSTNCRGDVVAFADATSIFHALPIFVFAFTCHQNIILITNELVRPSKPRVLCFIAIAIALSLGQYIVVALAGYLTFGDHVRHDLLQSYPSSPALGAARLMIAIVVAFSYPLQSHPSRACIISIISTCASYYGTKREISASSSTSSGETAQHVSQWIFASSTLGFMVATVVVAVTVNDLSTVLSVVGATGSTIVSYLLPGMCYFCICPNPRNPLRYLAAFQFIVGLAIMPISLAVLFIH